MKQWLEAAKLLAVNPATQIVCPKCGQAALVVTDVPHPGDPSRWERHIECPACHTTAHMLMRSDPAAKELVVEAAGIKERATG